MNHIILSIQPQWLEKILNGEKTVEIRKTVPKLPCTVWLYCTKQWPALAKIYTIANECGYKIDLMSRNQVNNGFYAFNPFETLNGLIVAKFVLEKVDEIINAGCRFEIANSTQAETEVVAKASKMDFKDLQKYLGLKDGFAWHITNLTILDKPLALGDFQSYAVKYFKGRPTKSEDIKDIIKSSARYTFYRGEITRAPQSWQYCTPKGELQ